MTTQHLRASIPADLVRAAELLRAGSLVAFPTETVYGLGADALNPAAVAAIFTAKQRPAWDPVIVHLAEVSQLRQVADLPAELERRITPLTAAFWPGPLTLLLPRTRAVPDAVTAGRDLVGVRIPAHPIARQLLALAGIPIAAPSANRFGHTSPTTASHVLDDLDGRIAAVLDAGPTAIGVESTVLDPAQTPMMLYRPGAITAEALTSATGVAVVVHEPLPSNTEPTSLPSPGVGIRHYAPKARLILTPGNPAALSRDLTDHDPETTGVLLPRDWSLPNSAIAEPWGRWSDPTSLATELYRALRALDRPGITAILCPLPEPGGLNDALRDRLQKAARD